MCTYYILSLRVHYINLRIYTFLGFFQKLLIEKGGIYFKNNRNINELTSSALGGLFPTILTCPIELIMIQQQKYGGSFIKSLYHITYKYSIFSRGWCRALVPTIGRDTICVIGMYMNECVY